MSYSYETRGNDTYILTGKKAKDKDIVIKLGSLITDMQLLDAATRTSYALTWTIEKNNEDDKKINLKGEIDNNSYFFEMDGEKIVKELSDMVIKNQTLESCNTLSDSLEKGFNKICSNMLVDKGIFLCSSNPINAYTLVKHKGKTIGTASRISYSSSNILSIYEYVGKDLNRDMEIEVHAVIDNFHIKFRTSTLTDSEYDIYNSNEHTLGYFNYNAFIGFIKENESIEVPKISPINVPKSYTNIDNMNEYVKDNNSINDIERYRISLKPKVETIDINKFMLREFLV